jgi:O-antigen ligase
MPASPSPVRPAPSLWEWLQTALLAGNLIWTTLCLGGYRPETMVVAGGLTGALLAAHVLSRGFAPGRRWHPAGWLLLPFLAYAVANILWVTPVPWLGWRDGFGWAEMAVFFWATVNVTNPRCRRVLFATLVGLGLLEVVLAGYQRFLRPEWLMLGRTQADQFLGRSTGSFGIPNSLAAFLIVLLPVLGSLAWHSWTRRARLIWLGVAAIFALGVVLTISRGAWTGLAVALVVWPLAAGKAGWGRRLGLALGVLTATAVVVGSLALASPKIRDRLVHLQSDAGERTRPILWQAGWRLFVRSPVTGSGAGSYDVLFERYRPFGFTLDPKWAHNDYLNTLSDYGAVGFLLFFGAVGAIAWRCATGAPDDSDDENAFESPATLTALGIGLLAFALHLFVDFHLKMPALAMEVAIVAGLVVRRRWPVSTSLSVPARAQTPAPASSLSRSLGVAAALAVLAGTVGLVLPAFRAEALRYRAREAVGRLASLTPDAPAYGVDLAAARADLARAVALDPRNAQAWSDSALAASLQPFLEPNRTAELGREAEEAANRALAISQAIGDFWTWRGTAVDMQGRWAEATPYYEQATRLSPHRADPWYHYAYHLSLNPLERDATVHAAELCLRLDPENPNGQWLRQHLAISPKAP